MNCLRILTYSLGLALVSPLFLSAQISDLFSESELVARLAPAERPFPADITPVAGGAIFLAIDNADPLTLRDLWFTDGTRAGTVSLQPPGLRITRLFATEGSIQWFQALDEEERPVLWRTDGTTQGTFELAQNIEIFEAVGYDQDRGLFFATADDTSTPFDLEPWVSDGSVAGTHLLKDLAPNADGASTSDFASLGGQNYFIGRAPEGSGFGLWRSDGTTEGTVFVAGDFRFLWGTETSLYMTALDDRGHVILYRSDGTADGTVAIQDFGVSDPDIPLSEVMFFGDFGDGRVLWRVDRTIGPSYSLWVSDGSVNGAAQVLELDLSPLTRPVRLGSALFFLARTAGEGLELWRSDGTVAGTRMAVERCPGPCDGFTELQPQRVANDRLWLSPSPDPETGVEPLVSDGTAAGTFTIGDLCPGPCSSLISLDVVDLGGVVVFSALRDTTNRVLVASDLSPGGFATIAHFSGLVIQPVEVGDSLLFAADDGAPGFALWKLPIPPLDPLPPTGPWSSGSALPGFEVKVRISAPGVSRAGTLEPACISETLCFSGAVPGRSEVFVRIVGPKPNGRLWPTLVKFTTSTAEIWIRQLTTGETRYYRLEGASPGFDELPGLFDRRGFAP